MRAYYTTIKSPSKALSHEGKCNFKRKANGRRVSEVKGIYRVTIFFCIDIYLAIPPRIPADMPILPNCNCPRRKWIGMETWKDSK